LVDINRTRLAKEQSVYRGVSLETMGGLMLKYGISMDDHRLAAISQIKSKVELMLKERQAVSAERHTADASSVWSVACEMFDYLPGMRDESFGKLRLHTYVLTSDSYLPYVLGSGKEGFRRGWEGQIKNIPEKYIIQEPEGGFGYRFGDRLISQDTRRYQRTINALYQRSFGDSNFLSLLEADRWKCVLEIGGGYGALAHHLSSLATNTTFVIIDLPETLLFSASYVSLHNPKKNVYVYDRRNSADVLGSKRDLAAYDFVFVPNFKLDALRAFKFDLVINQNSLGEMTDSQVQEYLDVIAETCTGEFYSYNLDRLWVNTELGSLTDALAKNFALTEVVSANRLKVAVKSRLNALSKRLARITKNPRPKQYFYYREYFCKSLFQKS
jgi:SAM-dependent methyltransferase